MPFWEPDTCGCRVEEVYGGADIVTSAIVTACPAHAGLTVAEWDAAVRHGENRPKNKVQGAMLDRLDQAVDIDAQGRRMWKPGVTFAWRWEGAGASRILYVRVDGYTLTQNQRNTIAAWIAASPHAGRIVLE